MPAGAITVTIPALMSGQRLFTIVPGAHKRDASILRTHPASALYLDAGSSPAADR